ncbi:GNAT family N-acetyltransferase [Methylophilus sp. 3sh_L]|uniref:GNAT family N-acetyltransferase n=1 Tax=Methylophilus sp. 3sh_L TaxID=3377114 RepID=UPI00398EEA8E
MAAKTQQILLKHAESDAEVLACFNVMRELRPNLISAESFLEQVTRMRERGYRLLAALEGDVPVALAGYRDKEMLIHGHFIYVDDLITSESRRGQKLGERLLQYIFALAKTQHYSKVILDTGIGNALAQRFYYRMGMLAMGMHFSYELGN